ncbi:phosphate ABC transporter ATP-binding protein [Alkalicella caledoniensis]|uniref:Phosphate ABC transporter ATP-binding protein n=1 Tax=Alkalicella caledoniensis TaxID=2731377 RepID=A0A7G9W6W3_ALKCA|nr:phosphate ABC transporter ATP-binding protein [Alkalicella caledoniensis]QNO14425.1 phosphate ABC transporter ATP-binding protein [Alkalicella caledoniensis]
MGIKLSNIHVSKSDGTNNLEIIKNLNIEVQKEDIFAIAGPSGSGKSTVLRLLNRLDDATSGEIYLDDTEIKSWDIRKLREKVGFVFQESALFEGSVLDNVIYGLRIRGIKKEEEQTIASALLEKVGLDPEYLDRDIEKLSGGQKQRVNIARTLALDPEIILLDEPTSALDPQGTKLIEDLMMELNEKHNKTIIFVTHNIDQIQRIAKRVLLLGIKKIAFFGTKGELFESTDLDITTFLKGGRE